MIGDKIRDRREYLGMSRQEVADKGGCSVQTIYKIEKGQSDSRIDILAKIATALECRIDYLLDKTNQVECKKKANVDYRKRFIEARNKKGLTRTQLCDKSGVSYFVVAKAENRNNPAWTRNFEAMCDVLEISVDWLFGRKEKMEI